MPHLAFQPEAMSDTPVLAMHDVVTSYYLRLHEKLLLKILTQNSLYF